MKRWFQGLVMSLSMFSLIPMPMLWRPEAMELVIPLFPLIGLLLGALWMGSFILLKIWLAPLFLKAFLLWIFPLIVSGFIHIDGFMDTADAVFSRQELAKKYRILKDPQMGAFGVIAFVCAALLGFSALASLPENTNFFGFLLIPFISRCLSALCLLYFKPFSDSGFGASFFPGGRWRILWLWSLFGLGIFLGYFLGGLSLLLVLIGMAIVSGSLGYWLFRQFRGFSGDLCGFVLVMSELTGLLGLVLVGG